MRILPLSNAQQRIWLEWKLSPQSPAYNNPLLYRLFGELDVGCLEQALQHIVLEQPALRSYFITQGGLPKQVMVPDCIMKLKIHDVSTYSKPDMQDLIEQLIAANVCKPFDISQLPLFRFSLIKTCEKDYLFVLNIHHIVVDGYSAQLLIQNISKYYLHYLSQDLLVSQNLESVYCEYMEQSLNEGGDSKESMVFWQNQFNDANIRIDLFQSDLPDLLSDEGLRHHFSISPELTQQIKRLAKQCKSTDFIVLMAAFYIVLGKYANQDDLTIGYPLDIRPVACRTLFGFFVNNLPFRLKINPNDTVESLVLRMNQNRKALKAYQKADLSQIIRYVRMLYPSYPDTLYNVSFIRANFALTGLEFPEVLVTPVPISTGSVKDDLCLLYDESDAFEFEIEFNKHRFDPDYIRQIQESYITCLQEMIRAEGRRISAFDLFKTIRSEPSTESYFPKTESLLDRFIMHAQSAPNKVAVVSAKESLSYRQLYADVLAWRQFFSDLLVTEKPVVVCLDRSPKLLAVLLALQWLEITYIPVDPTISVERLGMIQHDSQASFVICDPINASSFSSLSCQIIPISTAAHPITLSVIHAAKSVNPLVYIIYTSGSTGTPKGVAISKNALSNFLANMAHYFLNEDDSLMLALTTVAFDIAGLELLLPIWQQQSLYIASQEEHKDPFKITEILSKNPVTHMQATPAMWQMLGEMGWPGKGDLIALSGGEALSSSLAKKLLSSVGQLWNMYGPTEATIWCALKRIDTPEMITIGTPIANMAMSVLDKAFRPLPPYVKGDLYISGIGLAEGYVNNKALTQEQFINKEDALCGRIYRAGDIACVNSSGEFIIFGRTDNQIKLNGYRIELGEIEAHLSAIDIVTECAVIVCQQQLIAYVCLDQGIEFSEAEMSHRLARYMPDYMLPKRFILMDKLPMTLSGKIDRKALPAPKLLHHAQHEKPQNEQESAVLLIWQSVLQHEAIGVTDHFYSVGGHSLLALQLLVLFKSEFKTELSLAQILSSPTIRLQSYLLHTVGSAESNEIVSTDLLCLPLTRSMRRIWFISHLTPDPAVYHMTAEIHIRPELDMSRLEKAMNSLIMRHEPLRMQIRLIDHEPYQYIMDIVPFIIESVSGSILDWAKKPFDLFHGPMWRLCVKHEDNGGTVLGVCLHHMIADGYSVPLFLKELWALYDTGAESAPLIPRYMDYIKYESNKKDSMDTIVFWRHELLNSPYLSLPYDSVEPSDLTPSGAEHYSLISLKDWHALSNFCEDLHVSVSGFLMAAFGLLMQEYSQQRDFCIGIPFAHREHHAVTHMIGCFMDLIPMRMVIRDKISFSDWIKHIDKHLALCLAHSGLSFSTLLTHLEIERKGVESPLFPVVINIQPDPFKHVYSQEMDVQVKPVHTNTTKYDLSLEIYFTNEQAECRWEFSTALFSLHTIKQMSEAFQTIIRQCLKSPNQTFNVAPHAINPTINSGMQLLDLVYREPLTKVEKVVAEVWRKVLKVPHVGLEDHFFRLGGHSFLAATIISQLSDSLERSIPMELIFKQPRLIDFCEAIECIKPIVLSKKSEDFEFIPLTPNQRQMRLIYKKNADDLYHISVLVELPERIQVHQLEQAFNDEMALHSIYQWHLAAYTSQAQRSQTVAIKIEVLPWDASVDLVAFAEEKNKCPIRLDCAPLLRVILFHGTYDAVMVTVHHMISDEWSLQNLVQSVFNRYFHSAPSYKTSTWESHVFNWLEPDNASKIYWEHYLKNTVPSQIEASLLQNDDQTLASYSQLITADSINACATAAGDQEATLYHLSLALFIKVISQFTADDPLMFAVAYDRRKNSDRQALHGYLVNLLPLVISKQDSQSLNELIQWVKKNNINAMEHVDVDYAYLMEQGLTDTPAIVFNYQYTHPVRDHLGNALLWHPIASKKFKFPISIHLRRLDDGGMEVLLEYQATRYHPELIRSIVNTYIEHFQAMQEQASIPINSQRQLATHTDELMASLMRHHLSKDVAVHYLGKNNSYTTLWDEVDVLAKALLQYTSRETLAHEIIIIGVSDKYHQILGMLAALRVGAAFLSLDMHLPIERQNYLIEDTHAKIIIHDASLLTMNRDERFHLIDDLLSTPQTNITLPKDLSPSLPAYLIYTSGSTGVPKGVIIQRHALLQFIVALQKKLAIRNNDRILQFSSMSFDASIWELFLSFYSGATLCIPNEKERRVGASLQGFIQAQSIIHAILTPSVLNTLDPKELPSLKTIVSGGEACTAHLVSEWTQHSRFYNAYGPTEATVCVAMAEFLPGIKASVIGEALGEAILWVASPSLESLPLGAIGELMIGGPILALGYLNQDVLTKERFIQINGERWYRSGDRVRQINLHQFEYLGRLDRQVKLRGLRIELGEIEAALYSIAEIHSAYCLLDKDQLIAYIVADTVLSEPSLLNQLSRQLPNYLVPNRIVQIDTLPLLLSGKVDVNRLPKPEMFAKTQCLPQTKTEKKVHELWCQALNHKALNITDDFFSLGGNSLQAMELVAALEASFPIEFIATFFYSYPSIQTQSQYIDDKLKCINLEPSLEELLGQLSEAERRQFMETIVLDCSHIF